MKEQQKNRYLMKKIGYFFPLINYLFVSLFGFFFNQDLKFSLLSLTIPNILILFKFSIEVLSKNKFGNV